MNVSFLSLNITLSICYNPRDSLLFFTSSTVEIDPSYMIRRCVSTEPTLFVCL